MKPHPLPTATAHGADRGARIWGLDWSGARRPGRTAWAARGRWTGEALVLDELSSLEHWAGGVALDRPGMVRFMGAQAAALTPPLWIGLDAPFSLEATERRALGAADDLDLMDRLAELCPDPDDLRAAVQAAARARSDGSKERRRPVDLLAKTPMAPGNLRLYRQTWTALLLASELRRRGARLLPWQVPTPAGIHLLEVCPASLWRQLGLPGRGYKGAGRAPRDARASLLQGLRRTLPLRLDESKVDRAVDQTGGDALDAIAVAVGTVIGGLLLDPEQHGRLASRAPTLGGWVYGGADLPHTE